VLDDREPEVGEIGLGRHERVAARGGRGAQHVEHALGLGTVDRAGGHDRALAGRAQDRIARDAAEHGQVRDPVGTWCIDPRAARGRIRWQLANPLDEVVRRGDGSQLVDRTLGGCHER
jgi:hypothetical protein